MLRGPSGLTYTAPTATLTVNAGATASHTVNYATTDGLLTVSVSGPPAGAAVQIGISGASVSRTLSASNGSTTTALPAGSYRNRRELHGRG